jgi:hypothetical protein
MQQTTESEGLRTGLEPQELARERPKKGWNGMRPGPELEGLLRWSINRASREFEVTRPRLTKFLDECGIRPGQDGCFSSMQILCALTHGKEWRWDSIPE